MTDPYSYLVVYDLGTGDSTVFWAVDVEKYDHYRVCHGYKGERLEIAWSTPHVVKEKNRVETPRSVIARVEDCDPSEVEKGVA